MTPTAGRRMGEPGRPDEGSHPHGELGAYLLAALTAPEEAALEAHLLHCVLCQDRLLELAEVLPALARVPAQAASAPPAPSEPRRAAAPGTAGRASSHWRVAAAAGGVAAAVAAAVLVAVAIGARDPAADGGARAGGPSGSTSAAIVPVSMVRVFPYTGDDQVTVRAWNNANGAEVTVQCQNDRTPPPVLDPDRATYELWAVRDDGVAYKISSWQTVYGQDTFPGRLDFTVDRIKSFELRSAGSVLSVVQ